MATPQISELVVALLTSPRGILALGAAIGSLVVFVYLFVLKGDKSGRRSAPAKRTKQQAPKSGAAKKPAAKKPAPKKQQVAASADSKPKAKPAEKKAGKSATAASPAKEQTGARPVAKQANVKQAAQTKAQKDDSEWITVAKKKPRVSSRKSEEPAGKQPTRGSTRKPYEGSARPETRTGPRRQNL